MQNRENDSPATVREMYWDEDNRLMVLSDNGKTSRYTYNHSGERIVKSHGTMEGVYINGAPQGITFHETDEFTLYPASIISVNKNRFTKHYFIGNKRVASRIGSGSFNNVYGMNGCNITAGQQDYAERLNQIESQKEDYYRELGIAPGIPTMKGSYGDPENTGVGYNTIIRNLGDHSVPAEWAEYVKKNEQKDTAPGAPIAWESPSQPEEVQPGYGYVADNNEFEETFYYHSDHLGSTSYITDDSARVTQYTAYLPYGELLVDEHTSSEDLPYKFNGKELDEETGLYYYGARYMQPIASIWYGVDPLTEKYPDVSAYTYCMGNPVKLVDPDGKSTWVVDIGKGKYKVSGGNLNDHDKNIYVGTFNKKGVFVSQKSIGITTSTTSFYNSDKKRWSGTIDINDKRGDIFLTHIISQKLKLVDYMKKGVTGGMYDFKATNFSNHNYLNDIKGENKEQLEKARNEYIYRGMPIGVNARGQTIYTSARDIGNIAAGYVAGSNNLPYHTARLGFDGYQGGREGLSTRAAEYYGWVLGVKSENNLQRRNNFMNSVNSFIKNLFK